ncbi:MAG: YoaK family protein [Cetobacterium sp.]|uniref:YoaK family protein n=1 Tax=unclassified Cetobacterium TaxID=2630983 RepID=UPI00163CDDE4|nr:YoaK family protein [Cetobacterium sp. 2A]
MEEENRTLLYWINFITFLSGALNVAGMLAFSISISHLTGNLSRVPIDIFLGNVQNLYKVLGVLIMFLCGAIVSGILIGEKEFKLKKRYGVTFIVMALIVGISNKLLYGNIVFMLILAMLMGLQNGLFIMYKGTVIRTTHITGSVTDLGIYIGHYLKGNKSVAWRLRFFTYNISSFTLGGILGVIGYKTFEENFFYFFSLAYVLVALFYFEIRRRYYSQV